MKKIPHRASAVVTGAGSGFGRAIALELATRGARVVVSDLEHATAEETAAKVRAAGGEAEALHADVRNAEDVKRLVDHAHDRWGGVDVMVNNAGVAVVGAVGEVPLEDWRFEIDVNLLGVIHGCHFAIPAMKRAGRGWILNVASAAGFVSAPMMGPYNVTKAGVISLTETLRTELEDDGITVSALCPTFFRTNIHRTQRSPEKLRASSAKLVENAKWTAEGVARVALRGLERGELYVIPQADGKAIFHAKRALAGGFYSLSGKVARRMISK